jgi:hypothetical protein
MAFEGRIQREVIHVPLTASKSYGQDGAGSGSAISESAFFSVRIEGREPLSVELHNLPKVDRTYLVVRKLAGWCFTDRGVADAGRHTVGQVSINTRKGKSGSDA